MRSQRVLKSALLPALVAVAGGAFGLGAEIGISTDKFHARGPCGLVELTTYKYVVLGNGQVRS